MARAEKTTEKKTVSPCRVVSVFGPFASRALVDMPVALAEELFGGGPLDRSVAPTRVIDGVQGDIERLAERTPGLADSALAASAVALAYELDDPYNSATSKSMCARALAETLDRLRELAPAEEEKDGLDELADKRARRRGGAAAEA